MKKILCFVLVLVLYQNIFAQKSTVDKERFDEKFIFVGCAINNYGPASTDSEELRGKIFEYPNYFEYYRYYGASDLHKIAVFCKPSKKDYYKVIFYKIEDVLYSKQKRKYETRTLTFKVGSDSIFVKLAK